MTSQIDSEEALVPQFTVFSDDRKRATGQAPELAEMLLGAATRGESVFVYNDRTGRLTDFDPRSGVLVGVPGAQAVTEAEPEAGESATRGRGRPKLGVVAREVTLLPRHWDWLAQQPGGASVVLRKLVEDARRTPRPGERCRAAREAAYRFLQSIGGDRPGYEAAIRALFAGDRDGFLTHLQSWPADLSAYAQQLAADAWQ